VGSPFRLGRPTSRARELRNEATDTEQALWLRLRRSQLSGLKFSRQLPIAGYVCDFVCRSHKLIVELDGSQHHDQVAYDTGRTAELETFGYRVIRFWNSDVFGNIEGVLQAILEAANNRERGAPPHTPSRMREGESE
jgi:very-short-patch-repair endonuclease